MHLYYIPNNCSGHGKCVNGECECFTQPSSEKLNFVGSDCSLFACPVGVSYSCLSEKMVDYSSRSVDDGLSNIRILWSELNNKLKNRRLLENEILERIEIDGDNKLYKMRLSKEIEYEGIGGGLNCFKEDGDGVFYVKLLGKENDYYILQFDDYIPSDSRLDCKVVMNFSDYSLFNEVDPVCDSGSGSCTVTWSKMDFLLKGLTLSKDIKMKCTTGESNGQIDMNIDESHDVIFTFSYSTKPEGKCHLLAKRDGNKIVTVTDSESDYYKANKKVTTAAKQAENIYYEHKNIYAIPIADFNLHSDVLAASPYKTLKCSVPGYKEDQNAYLFGKDTDNYYILYDFTPTDLKGTTVSDNPIPYLYKCSLVEGSSSDLIWYYPYSIGECSTAAACAITWANIGFTYSLVDANQKFQFACVKKDEDKPKNEGNLKIYNYKAPNTIPTSSDFSITFNLIERDNKNYPKDRICFLLGKIDGNNKIVSIDIKESSLINNVKEESSEKIYIWYNNLPQTVDKITSTPNNNIYKLTGLIYDVNENGGSLECHKREDNSLLGLGYLLRQNSLNYYIKYENNPTDNKPSDYRCDLLYKHNDLSLYNGKLNVESEKRVTMKGIGYFLKLMGLLKDLNKIFPFLCKIGDDKYDIYEFKISTTSDAILSFSETVLGDLLFETESEDVLNGEGSECYLLINNKGERVNVLESDLKNEFTISYDEKNKKYNLESKVNYEISGSVYKVNNLNLDIDMNINGGEIDCYDFANNKYVASYIIKLKMDNTYYLNKEATNDIAKYKCYLSYKYNDLSLYGIYPYTYGDKTITMNDEGFYLKSMGLLDKIKYKEVSFLCGSSSSGSDYKIYQFKLDEDTKSGMKDFTESNLGNVVFTLKENVDPPPTGTSSCFLLSDVNGNPINDPNESDLKHKYTIAGDSSAYRLTAISSVSLETIGSYYKNAYVNYDIDENGGGLLHCYKTTDGGGYVGKATILGKKGNDYIIKYPSSSSLTADSYKCILTEKYNDISHLTTTIVSGEATGELTMSGIKSALGFFGYNLNNKKVEIACHLDDNSEIILYNATVAESADNDAVKITIDSNTKVVKDTVCHILTNNKGEKVELYKSDLRNNHLLIEGDRKEYKYYENKIIVPPNGKPSEIDEKTKVKLNGNLGELGGKVECIDKDGKSLGTATIYKLGGEEEKYKIIYDFIPPNSESTEIGLNVINKVNDLSSINIDGPSSDDCYVSKTGLLICPLILDGFKSILDSYGFYSDIKMRSLGMNDLYDVACKRSNGEYHLLKYKISGDSILNSAVDYTIFEIDQSNKAEDLPIDEECNILSDARGERKSIKGSDLESKVKIESDGKIIAKGSDIKSGEGYKIEIKDKKISMEYSSEFANSFNGKDYIIIDEEDLNKYSEYFLVGKWLNFGGSSLVQIIKISSKTEEFEFTPSPSGNGRLLQREEFIGRRIIFNKALDFSSSTSEGSVTFGSENRIDIRKKLECSGVGECDRSVGICKCYDGFSGSSCERVDCPSNCNGNGRCVSLSELLGNEELIEYNNDFDHNRIYGCLCDNRHRGYDCSLMECPSGVDPEGVSNIDGLEYRDCSGRGICDYSSGVCECFSGFYGEGCQYEIETM